MLVFLEALLMEIAIEIIREASARLPGPLVKTIGIVAALFWGDAAVRATTPNYYTRWP